MGNKKYEGFSLALALFDAVPVIFFSTAMLLIAVRFQNILFIAGAICCAFAGLGKVSWKIIIAVTGKDIHWLNKQLRLLIPVGFLLMISGVVFGINQETWQMLKIHILTFPSNVFFGIALIGMILMGVFAGKLDSTKIQSNWIEQITNAIAQGCFLLGVLFCI